MIEEKDKGEMYDDIRFGKQIHLRIPTFDRIFDLKRDDEMKFR